MLGIVLALAVTAQPAMPSASVMCPGWPASCDAVRVEPSDSVTDDGPPASVASVEFDCPAPPDPPVPLAAAASECTEPAFKLWFRVSRTPDSELPTGSLAPAPHRTRAAGGISAGGRPDVGHFSQPNTQPVALVALPTLVAVGAHDASPVDRQAIPTRALAPPERPPRA